MTAHLTLFPLPDVPDLLDVDSCQAKWNVEPGEVFVLRGQTTHVLICGDSMSEATVGVLADLVNFIGEFKRRLMMADPPYGIGLRRTTVLRLGQGGHQLGRRIKDAELDGGDVFDPSWMPVWRDIFEPHAVYVFSQWTVTARWKLAMELAGWGPKARLIWDKMHFGAGDATAYGDQTEDILCWYERGHSPMFETGKRQGNVWSEARGVCLEGGMVGHPTPKPFGVYRRPIEHMTKPGDLVVDPFGGSGPALIVADGMRRHAAVVDSSPRYCALMLERCSRYEVHVINRARNLACTSPSSAVS